VSEYKKVCTKYEEAKDYPTASYFYQKCLIMSKQAKYAEGEATSYMGLGFCEEGERNIVKAQEYYETALEKGLDKDLHAIVKQISEQLIRIYEKLAVTYEDSGDYQKTLDYYDKCLDASKRALNPTKEAECYYKLGMTYEKTKELEKSVEALEKFLSICEKNGNQV
jgi:tetratricopeptide (TPR) repeat protein